MFCCLRLTLPSFRGPIDTLGVLKASSKIVTQVESPLTRMGIWQNNIKDHTAEKKAKELDKPYRSLGKKINYLSIQLDATVTIILLQNVVLSNCLFYLC